MLWKTWEQPQPYVTIWQNMLAFVQNRNTQTLDECWFLEHEPVFTLGQAGDIRHLIGASNIACVQSDRGGQITYHGPGQWVSYLLFDLERKGLNVKDLVRQTELAVIEFLANFSVEGHLKAGKPGIYIDGDKVASVGFRIKRGMSYHGVALNMAMDLTPFKQINPCGYSDQKMTQVSDHCPNLDLVEAQWIWKKTLMTAFAPN
jgi:lipoyl(octanoyl) transferase